jgi:hypothetical protein
MPDLLLSEVRQLLIAGGGFGASLDRVAAFIQKWTHGHPYWSQLLAERISAGSLSVSRRSHSDAAMDELIRTEDRNLPHIAASVNGRSGEAILQRILSGGRIAFSRADRAVAELELVGIVRNLEGVCAIRNKIYERFFQQYYPVSGDGETPPLRSSRQSSRSTVRPRVERCCIFLSYAHRDGVWVERLRTALTPLMRDTDISLWDDSRIEPGKKWKEEVSKALYASSVAVLLVSPDYLASDFIVNNELPPLLRAATDRGLRLLWLPVDYSSYDKTVIREYQALRDPRVPLRKLSAASRTQALVEVARAIVDACRSSKGSSAT